MFSASIRLSVLLFTPVQPPPSYINQQASLHKGKVPPCRVVYISYFVSRRLLFFVAAAPNLPIKPRHFIRVTLARPSATSTPSATYASLVLVVELHIRKRRRADTHLRRRDSLPADEHTSFITEPLTPSCLFALSAISIRCALSLSPTEHALHVPSDRCRRSYRYHSPLWKPPA